MRSGRWLVLGLVAFLAIAGAALFYLQAYHYYQRVDGATSIEIGGRDVAVRDYVGLDNPALPLRLRGCFAFEDPEAAIAAGEPLDGVRPFGAPFWFDCWDAAAIDAALRSGDAVAVLAGTGGEGDFATQTIVVVHRDGRGYLWRRLASDAR